jgi:hypothetical protein
MSGVAPETHYGTAKSRWSGVGPYYAMFPSRFADTVIREHTKPGELILDPFAGRGTSVFSAASAARAGVGIEINPVGWVYGKAKVSTADQSAVEARIRWLGTIAHRYRAEAQALPDFFMWCYCPAVREFLLAARAQLDWRRNKVDRTTMALILVDLHGKRGTALSNQMRQTKSLSPQYAVMWWRERNLAAPVLDPVQVMMKKIAWRYAKGRPDQGVSQVYLGDSRTILARLKAKQPAMRASLLLTSPPYYGVANYFYDQWLRLWLLGGSERPRRLGEANKGKFEDRKKYQDMLLDVFSKSASLLAKTAVIVVRTDSRSFTLDTTVNALTRAFPQKELRSQLFSRPDSTQTELFRPDLKSKGEVDLVMW